uniref:Uncharacterized protein n=1 Tax=Arundo donax TaxID=35708 RepID=A0A0A9BUA9_ARUDO
MDPSLSPPSASATSASTAAVFWQ